jgi:hypothetical protein
LIVDAVMLGGVTAFV